MLSWAKQFNICCFLDNQNYQAAYNSFECLTAVGSVASFEPSDNFYGSLSSFVKNTDDWLLGHFNYEIKNKILTSSAIGPNHDRFGFSDSFLFVPQHIVILSKESVTIGSIREETSAIFSDISSCAPIQPISQVIAFEQRISREKYLANINTLKNHIKKGDCYEINFCQEFYAVAEIDPGSVFTHLTTISPNPFSAFYRDGDNYLMCASPERFLKKVGDKVISQPIKGTAPRDRLDANADEAIKNQLKESAKDKIENVMIVDLVRNDLSKISGEGSVRVEEIFEVYSYPQVHQMISTVAGSLKEEMEFGEILQATFPMGSMTGAPKEKVMQLIDKYEEGPRGIYSGTLGYISPNKDFDFNVVIRSLVYNAKTNYLSFHTGSAITATSDAEKEYEECLLKGKAIIKVFSETKEPG